MLRWWGVIVGVVVAGSADAAPRLSYAYPIGYERGKTITLILAGQSLAGDVEVLSKIPGSCNLKAVDMVDGKPAYNIADRRDLELTIAPDAPVGLYPIRVRTAEGISNQVLFAVGSLPDVAEVEPNNLVTEAQPIPLGCTVSGSVGPADRDFYAVTLPAGTRLVAEVEAKRIGMPMDSSLVVLDSQGRELARSDDAVGLDADSRVDVTISRAGNYIIVVHDVTYQSAASYRLKVGSYDYADGVFPLGGAKSPETKVWTWTQRTESTQPVVFSTADADRWTMVQPMGSNSPSLPIRFVVSAGEEIVESQMPLEITRGQTANGRIAAPGEKDAYLLKTEPGQRWRLSVSARKLGSMLDAALAVENAAGQTLVRSIDQLDPVFDFVVPPDTNSVRLVVDDLHGRGGPGFAYRLKAELLAADFSLQLVPDTVNVPIGSVEFVAVRVDRKGYTGPIQLYIPEKVAGVTAEAGLIPAGANEGFLLLSAPPATQPRRFDLEVWGRGGSPTRPIDRQVRGSDVNHNPFVAAQLIDLVPAALCGEKPFKVDVSARSIAVVHSMPAQINLTIARGPEVTEDIRIEPRVRIASYPTGLEGTIPKGQNTGAINFPSGVEYGLSQGTMVFDAVTLVAGREVRVTLPPIDVAIVRPFNVRADRTTLTIPATGNASLLTFVERVGGFAKPVAVRVEDLPKGCTAEPTTLDGDARSANLMIKAENTPPGEYTVKLIGSADVEGRKQTKDYEFPPIEIRLTVTPPASESVPPAATN
jgi:hypothetical protein